MDNFANNLSPMGPRQDLENRRSSTDPVGDVELLRALVREWLDQDRRMPKSLKHEGFWIRIYAMMIARPDQVAEILDPLLDEPLPPILALLVRARLRRFAEENGDGERARELASQEHAIASAADDEHFKVLALSALVPFLSRVMELSVLSKETTRIGLLGIELFNRTLDGWIEAVQSGDTSGRAMRRAIYVTTTVEGFQNLHLWLMVERLLDAGIYELAPDFVHRRQLGLTEMLATQAQLAGQFSRPSFFRMLAAWELSAYERDQGLAPTTDKLLEQWREAASLRASSSEGWFQPDQADLQAFATYSFSLASTPTAFEAIGAEIVDATKAMRMALVHRVEARLTKTPKLRELCEQRAQLLENSVGVTWPHYSEHVALSDMT